MQKRLILDCNNILTVYDAPNEGAAFEYIFPYFDKWGDVEKIYDKAAIATMGKRRACAISEG